MLMVLPTRPAPAALGRSDIRVATRRVAASSPIHDTYRDRARYSPQRSVLNTNAVSSPISSLTALQTFYSNDKMILMVYQAYVVR
jgi:hypothetical protein